MKVARSRLEPHRGPCHIAPPCSWLYAPWLKFFIDAGGIGEARCALAFLVTHLRKTFWSEFLNMLRQPGKDDYIYIYIYTSIFDECHSESLVQSGGPAAICASIFFPCLSSCSFILSEALLWLAWDCSTRSCGRAETQFLLFPTER